MVVRLVWSLVVGVKVVWFVVRLAWFEDVKFGVC